MKHFSLLLLTDSVTSRVPCAYSHHLSNFAKAILQLNCPTFLLIGHRINPQVLIMFYTYMEDKLRKTNIIVTVIIMMLADTVETLLLGLHGG